MRRIRIRGNGLPRRFCYAQTMRNLCAFTCNDDDGTTRRQTETDPQLDETWPSVHRQQTSARGHGDASTRQTNPTTTTEADRQGGGRNPPPKKTKVCSSGSRRLLCGEEGTWSYFLQGRPRFVPRGAARIVARRATEGSSTLKTFPYDLHTYL